MKSQLLNFNSRLKFQFRPDTLDPCRFAPVSPRGSFVSPARTSFNLCGTQANQLARIDLISADPINRSVSEIFLGAMPANSASACMVVSPCGTPLPWDSSLHTQSPFLIGLWIVKSPSDTTHPSFVIVEFNPTKARVLSDISPVLRPGTWRTPLRMREVPLGSLISMSPTPTALNPLPIPPTYNRCLRL